MTKKPSTEAPDGQAKVTLPAIVEKIIPPIASNHPETAQIAIDGAEELYREIRVDNALMDETGNSVALKKGAEVEVTIKADADATAPKK
jgi:hypothetical protein